MATATTSPLPVLEAALTAARTAGVLHLPEARLDEVRRELERVLAVRTLLLSYLQLVGEGFTTQEPPPNLSDDVVDTILDTGLGNVTGSHLAALVLNPDQMSALHSTIVAEPSPYWAAVQEAEVSRLLGPARQAMPAAVAARVAAILEPGEQPVRAVPWRLWLVLAVAFALGVLALGYRDMPRNSLASLDWWAGLQRWLLVYGLVGALLPFVVFAAALRRRNWLTSGQLLGLVGVVLLLSLGGLGVAENRQARTRRVLDELFVGHRYVTYDAPGHNPYPETFRMPDEAEVSKDLETLREAGFDGVITFQAGGTYSQVPRLAKAANFRRVIMGIAVRTEKGKLVDPQEQIAAAIAAAADVDAYIVGHNPPTQIDLTQLADWMAQVRTATGKPVSTTAPLDYYRGARGQDLREIGDFYAPDVHGSWMYGAGPHKVFEELRQTLRDVADLPRDKPVLLKMVSMPSAGSPEFTEESQAEFYTWLTRDFFLPPGVYLSYYNSYDLRWMAHEAHPREWSRPQQHVGLFHADRRPKLAVEVVRHGFPVQNRP